jgi:hypothetical protein
MNGHPMFQANPFLGPWLAASRSVATAWGQAWLGPFARQQSDVVADFSRQWLQLWTTGWMQTFPTQPTAEAAPRSQGEPVAMPRVQLAEMAETVEVPAAPAAEPPVPPPAVPAVPGTRSGRQPAEEAVAPVAKRGKPVAQLRAVTPRRTAAKPKASPSRSPRVTRH